MPKRVDHHERRRSIADALIRVAAGQGLEGVSLRHVAAEAGVSSGMVQHYFPTRDEMMVFALAAVRDHHQARIAAVMAGLGADPSPRDTLRALITAMLPLDDEGRRYGRVALAFLAYTAVRPDVADGVRGESADLLGHLAGLIRAGAPAVTDPDSVAAALLSVIEGLGVHLLGGVLTPRTAQAAADAQLDLIFGPTR